MKCSDLAGTPRYLPGSSTPVLSTAVSSTPISSTAVSSTQFFKSKFWFNLNMTDKQLLLEYRIMTEH